MKSSTSDPLSKWDLASIIDLEYLCSDDDAHEDEELKQRDRNFFLQLAESGVEDAALLSNKTVVLRRWVENRRESTSFPRPGQATAEILASLQFWGFLGLVLFGALFTWGALNISGTQVNVILFSFLTVGIPLLLSLVGFYLLFSERYPRLAGSSGFLANALGRQIFDVGFRTARSFDRKLPQAQRLRVERIKGASGRRLHGHGPVISGTLTSLVHLLGLGMVIGIFISIFLFRTASDQNYGWKTHSGWLTEGNLHSIVRVVATPWRWYAADGIGYPTMTQIHETRIFKNDSNHQVNLGDSITWSSFLMWSSLYYGLLPRLALFTLGKRYLRCAFAHEDFHKYDTLWRRLTIQDVVINTPTESPPPDLPSYRSIPSTNVSVQGSVVLLIPQNLDANKLAQELVEPLRNQSLHYNRVVVLPSLPTERQSLLQSLAERSAQHPARLMILQESFMPPNASFLRFVSTACRDVLGVTIPIHVILLHDSDRSNAGNLIAAWRHRFGLLGDPLISLVVVS